MQNQELFTFTGSKGDDDFLKTNEISKTLSTQLYEDTEFDAPKTRTKAKAHSKCDLKIDLSNTPILGFDGSSANSNGSNKLNVQSRMLPTKHSWNTNLHVKKDSRLENFDINKIMHSALGIHSLTDYTYKEQQLIEEAVN